LTTRPLRIAVTHPTCWPEIRRGSERLLHDLSHFLAERGHDVTVISTVEGHTRTEVDGPVTRHLIARHHPLPVRTRWWSFFHAFAGQLRDHLLAERYDAVHCLNYHDAWGALRARRRGARFRLIYQLTGIPVRRYFRRIPLDGLMFADVLRQSDEVLAISRFALDRLHTEYGRPGLLIPAPTNTAPYRAEPKTSDAGQPMILFVGDADEPRKGALLLARAFAVLAGRGLVHHLDYSGRAGDAVRNAVLNAVPEALRGRVTFHGLGQTGDLPRLYARASVVVNPAIWEAQGMVLVEALASGTPVVGCDHAGTPDIVSDTRIGRLFVPATAGLAADNLDGLVTAIEGALDLARLPQTVALCRSHAAAFDWERIGPAYEAALVGSPQGEPADDGKGAADDGGTIKERAP